MILSKYHKVNWHSGSLRWCPYREKEEGSIKREWEENHPDEYADHVLFCPHITSDACQRGPQFSPLFPEPKALHSHFDELPNSAFCWPESARLVLRWGLKEAGECSVWPQLSVRHDGICRDKTSEHKLNEKSIFRKSQQYVGCLTSAAWIHEG